LAEEGVFKESATAQKAEELLRRLDKAGISLQKLEDFLDAIESASKEPSKIRYYATAMTRLRKLEKETGKSISALLKEYEKKTRELVTIEYAIDDLKKKRARLEEDLEIYMQQRKLTLEIVNRVNSLLSVLEQYKLGLDDIERLVAVLNSIKSSKGDPNEVIDQVIKAGDLNKHIAELEQKLKEVEANVNEASAKHDSLLRECAELLNVESEVSAIKSALEELKAQRDSLKQEVEELKRLRETLYVEYSSLLDVKGTVKDLLSAIENKKEELKKLDEEVSKKQTMLKELEDELNAARSLLTLLSEPQNTQPEDIEAIIQQMNNILKIKRGELPMLKPLEGHLLEKARKRLVELVIPALSGEFVPKWVFERLEKQFESLVEKRAKLEEELQSIKSVLKSMQTEATAGAPKEGEQIIFLLKTSTGEKIPKVPSDKKAKIICRYCRAGTSVWLPTTEELTELKNKGETLKMVCPSCNKTNIIDPDIILKLYQR
jgi:chromosome segregation ATPase